MPIDLNLLEIEGKRQECRDYIEEHRNNVKTVWLNILKCPELRNMVNAGMYGNQTGTVFEHIISQNIDIHDMSKYSEEEFEPYRRHFHSVNEKEKEESTFDYGIAWQHHKDNNKHHWQYWSERHIVNDMPWQYVVEMFCNHAAMSIKFGGTALEWFNEQLANKEIEVGEIQKTSYLKLAKLYYDKY